MLDSFDNDTLYSNNFGDSQGLLGNAVYILVREANQIPLETYQPSYGFSKDYPRRNSGTTVVPTFCHR